MEAARHCPRCQQQKLASEFPEGSGSYCVDCKREWNRERERTRQRDWDAENKARWARYKQRIETAFADYLQDVEVSDDDLLDWFLQKPKVRVVSLVAFMRKRYGSRKPLESYPAEIQESLAKHSAD